MQYQLAPLFCRPWTLNGMSPRLIESHYENNYGDALHRLNAITEELESLDPATTPAHVIRRLKREETGRAQFHAAARTVFRQPRRRRRGLPTRWPTRSPAISARSIAGARSSSPGEALAGGSGWVVLT